MKRIDKVLSQMADFLGQSDDQVQNKVTRKVFNVLTDRLRKANEFNIRAQITVGDIETSTLDISAYQYGDDYEVLTGSIRDEEGNEFSSIDEAREFYENQCKDWRDLFEVKPSFVVHDDPDLTSVWESFEEFEDALKYVLHNRRNFEDEGVYIKPLYFIYDKDGDQVGSDEGYEFESDAEEKAEDLVTEKIDEILYELEEYGVVEPDEIMWNTVWRFNDSEVDTDIAKKCGLAVIQFHNNEHENKTFLALTGAGMDLSPQLVAYKALKFGYVDESDIHKFIRKLDREYFEHVVGRSVALEVYRALGIYDAVMKEEEKAKAQELIEVAEWE